MFINFDEYANKFGDRLSQLRMQKGVSAREMSLSMGQAPGYINNIENKNNLPSMTVFFYICEYLGVTPSEFFDLDVSSPNHLNTLIEYARKLNRHDLEHITAIVQSLVSKG